MSFESVIDTLEIRNANKISFVGTSSSFIDTTTGRIQTKGIQHNSNVITDVSGPHGRIGPTLKKYPEISFAEGKFDRNDTTRTYTQAGYTVTASEQENETTHAAYGAFDGISNDNNFRWRTKNVYVNNSSTATPSALDSSSPQTQLDTNTSIGEYLILKIPKKIKLKSIVVNAPHMHMPYEVDIYGRNESVSTWSHVKNYTYTVPTGTTTGVYNTTNQTIDATEYYSEYAFVVVKTNGNVGAAIGELHLYGYEEDPPAGDHSVDTTFKSRFNNPQTTGVQVLVDGNEGQLGANQISGGPDSSGNSSTYVTDGKYWTLNGTLTSNLSIEANTFLEGDQPHAVSVWFNSSNLEANVSNTCVFSIASEEKLDSMNLDLQSNTWHNLTYAYQGEGGSRVTYLDGRKVSEDQAEDTFGVYPPFEIGTYMKGGYTVDASYWNTGASGARLAYNMFQAANGARVTGFSSSSGLLDSADSNYDATLMTLTDTNGTAHLGHWVSLELPYKLSPSYCDFEHFGSSYRLKDFVILGSNHHPRATKTGFTLLFSGQAHVDNNGTNKTIHGFTGSGKFKYLILLTKTIQTGNSTWTINRLQYYGHRENDLVRLPDPTNVLKYPHIKMTTETTSVQGPQINPGKPGDRGYEIIYSNHGGTPQLPSRVFDGKTNSTTNSNDCWMTSGGTYNTGDGALASGQTHALTIDGTSRGGSWVGMKMPRKLKLSSVVYYPRHGYGWEIYNGYVVGSNNGTSWDSLLTISAQTGWAANTPKTFTMTNNLNTYYQYFAILATHVQANNTAGRFAIQELEFYGTEEATPVPIQIGGGNIDKVANFRVYNKFIGEDQVNEIWNAQKEEFGRVKPQMVLQQGKLGIGTDAPQGSLSVADEPHNLEEFPPRAMTDYKTYFEGHGEFCVSASDEHSSNYDVQNAFNKITNRYNSSGGTTNTYYNGGEPTPRYYDVGNDYAYSGTSSTHGLGDVMGEWVKLEFPYKANISQIWILPVYTQINTLAPEDFTIMGSSDDINWTTLRTVIGATWTANKFNEYTLPSTTSYKYFALVISRTVGSNQVSIQEVKYFGTREQGQTALHDGQLTLTKNLNVSRIGSDLDSDDTPRRDRLIVEYNTSTNPTFNGAVKDTSGRGNDAVFRGAASYDITKRAFNFTNHTRSLVIAGDNISGVSGDILGTFSLWFITTDRTQQSGMTLFQIGNSNSTGKKLNLFLYEDDVYMGFGGQSYVYAPGGDVKEEKWTHVVGIKKGTGGLGSNGSTTGTHTDVLEIYIDGERKSVTFWTGTDQLNIDRENQIITVGGGSTDVSTVVNGFDGYISNVKFWGGVALTAQEVKTLYDMGRCDEGHHLVNFSKTRVGIGLEDGTPGSGAYGTPSTLTIRGNQEVKGDIVLQGADSGVIFNQGSGSKWKIIHGGGTGAYSQLHFKRWYHIGGGVNSWGDGGYISWDGHFIDNFTGQHKTFIKDVPFSQADDLYGLIVSSDQNKYIKMSNGIEAGSNAITMNESLPVVSLSNIVTDKKCFGVISASEDPENRTEQYGAWGTHFEKEKGDTRVYINSVGEGAIWVVNTNGSLESGDYITTSNVTGYGQKQDSEFLANYTVAKITMDCDFEPATQPVQQILRSNVVQTYYLGDVHHVKSVPYEIITTEEGESNVIYDTKYTLTTTANVTESDPWDNVFIDPPEVTYIEYSNLEANVQSTYTLTFTQTTTDEKTPTEWSALESNVQSLYNKVYYESVEEEVAADYPGAVAHTRVTDKIENTLDEYGQIQWEDHPTETEKAYKVRYLTADGTQTDEANAVHIAAFVGCTYHCG